jgi:uncharacterized LabA/DUF88 family protein
MSRVMVYVDGFNLYFGLRSKGWRKHYWLDLVALAQALLKPGQTLQGVHYFTSRIRANGRNVADMQRQTAYIEALGTLGALQLHFGHYLEKPKQCRQCGAKWMDYEEKMTDVNIAVQMLADAFDDRFDTALLISGDSDLTTPVCKLRAQFPAKRLIVAFPPERQSFELKKAANATFTIGEANLRQSQLPAQVQRADGFMLQRPAHWQ